MDAIVRDVSLALLFDVIEIGVVDDNVRVLMNQPGPSVCGVINEVVFEVLVVPLAVV